MNRADYIRLAAAFLLPHTKGEGERWNLDEAIRYAAAIWERTGGAEIEAPATRKPRELRNEYATLPAGQRAVFERFWAAYGYKVGKERAAGRWAQLNPAPELAEKIIAGANADRLKERPKDQARKHPEGWLAERRWADFEPTVQAPVDAAKEARRLKVQELNGLEALYKASRNPGVLAQIATLRTELKMPAYQPPAQRGGAAPSGFRSTRDALAGP